MKIKEHKCRMDVSQDTQSFKERLIFKLVRCTVELTANSNG